MSLVVVLLVGALAFLYVTSNRRARKDWIRKLDLKGRWHWQDGDATLVLTGGEDRGQFELREGGRVRRGFWQMQGHFLCLQHSKRADGNGKEVAANLQERLDLHFFKPGSIGLEDEKGQRRVYVKETSNVVQLKSH